MTTNINVENLGQTVTQLIEWLKDKKVNIQFVVDNIHRDNQLYQSFPINKITSSERQVERTGSYLHIDRFPITVFNDPKFGNPIITISDDEILITADQHGGKLTWHIQHEKEE